MNYIKRSKNGIEIDGIELSRSLVKYIDEICLKNGSSLQGRLDFSKHFLKSKKVPIFINKECILFSTTGIRNYDTVLINYLKILDYSYYNGLVKVIFNDCSVRILESSERVFKNQLKKCEEIVRYLT